MELSLLTNFLVSVAIGGLVGLEREIYQQKGTRKKKRGFAGIRTYLIVALLGAITSYIAQRNDLPVLIYIVLGGIIILIVTSYYVSAVKGYMGLTTELSVLLVYVLSSVSMIEDYQNLAVILSVILAILLSAKDLLHGFAKKTKQIEWYDTLKFVFMVFVILPLLPNKDFAILGVNDAFNPYETWLMVIFVSGVSFVGYVLTKMVGGAHGIGLTGVLGGLVSSTAVTQSTAQDSKKNPKYVDAYAFAAVAATVVKLFRVMLEVWVVDFSMLSLDTLPILVMSLAGIAVLARWSNKAEVGSEDKNEAEIKLGSPLSLRPAIMFGLIYSVISFITRAFAGMNLSSFGYAVVGIVSGIADVDAVTLSMARQFRAGDLSSGLAWLTIVMAVSSNSMFKAFIARVSGSEKYYARVASAMGLIALVGLLVISARLI
ncbi:MgtC/SapB family protein [Candidatus Dojkabacteria bacterium]|nr:MgtC/SapB family protein [Candidatus Dojkabacteria bacterium]